MFTEQPIFLCFLMWAIEKKMHIIIDGFDCFLRPHTLISAMLFVLFVQSFMTPAIGL